MDIEATGHHQGDAEQFCEKLVILAADWHDAVALAELNRAISRPGGMRRVLQLARELNKEQEQWTH